MPRSHRQDRIPMAWLARGNEFKQVKTKRFVGIEIEVCGLHRPGGQTIVDQTVNRWGGNRVGDGSLPSGGFELRTCPASGDILALQVKQICEALTSAQAWVDHRAGLHVHVDCRDMTWFDLRRLMALFYRIQPALFEACLSNRSDNRYCQGLQPNFYEAVQRIKTVRDARRIMGELLYGSWMISRYRDQHYVNSRYYALNLHSWTERGSVETRMRHGSVNAEEITTWARFCAGLADVNMKFGDAKLMATEKPADIFAMIEEVSGISREAIHYRNYQQSNTQRGRAAEAADTLAQAVNARPTWLTATQVEQLRTETRRD